MYSVLNFVFRVNRFNIQVLFVFRAGYGLAPFAHLIIHPAYRKNLNVACLIINTIVLYSVYTKPTILDLAKYKVTKHVQ